MSSEPKLQTYLPQKHDLTYHHRKRNNINKTFGLFSKKYQQN